MAVVTPIISESDTEETVSGTTLTKSTDCVIAGADLVNGTKYLVLASASIGHTVTNANVELQVRSDSGQGWSKIVRRTRTIYGGSVPNSQEGGGVGIAFVMEGNGSDDLAFHFREQTAIVGNAVLGSKSLIAIPLTGLTTGEPDGTTQYDVGYKERRMADTWLTTASGGATITCMTATVEDSEAGNYLVFANMEINLTTAGDQVEAWVEVDGVQAKDAMFDQRIHPDVASPFTYMGVHWHDGSTDMVIDLKAKDKAGTGTKGFRRLVITTVRCNSWDMIVNHRNYDPETAIINTLSSWDTARLTRKVVPSEDQYVIAMANASMKIPVAQDSAHMRLRDISDSGSEGAFMGGAQSYATNGITPITIFRPFDLTSATGGSVTVDVSKNTRNSYWRELDIICWGMKTSTLLDAGTVDIPMGSTAFGGWSGGTGTPLHEQIDEDHGAAGATDTYIKTGAVSDLCVFGLAVPDDLHITQKISLGFDHYGDDVPTVPGCLFGITDGTSTPYVSKQLNMDTGAVWDEGFIPIITGRALMLTKAELESLVFSLLSKDGSADDLPEIDWDT